MIRSVFSTAVFEQTPIIRLMEKVKIESNCASSEIDPREDMHYAKMGEFNRTVNGSFHDTGKLIKSMLFEEFYNEYKSESK